MASKQQQAFRMCVHPCLRYLTGGHCVACLGEEHAQSALESTAMCFPCRHSDPAWCSFTMRALRLVFPRAPVPLLFLPSPDRFSASSQGWEARAAISSAPIEAQTLQLSDSEELYVVCVNARDTEDSPPQSCAY